MDDQGHGLEKYVWTDADFDRMGWHDCYVHGFHSGLRPERGEFDFLIALDYIVRWVSMAHSRLAFWIAPATLVFHNAHDIVVGFGPGNGDMRVDRLVRGDERLTPRGIVKEYHWDFWDAGMSMWATGFTQYIRRIPIFEQKQRFELEERGGVSFERIVPTEETHPISP